MTLGRWAVLFVVAAFWSVFGCSTTEVDPLPALPKVPKYSTVPHPIGYHLVDLKAVFNHPDAVAVDDLSGCDEKIRILKTKTNSLDERKRGARELVAEDPVFFHWCFYSRLVKLHHDINKTDSIKTRQKLVIDAYETLVPLANAFRREFQDTRYYRWAVKDYRKMSEAVFYRSLALTPESSVLIVESMPSPHALWRKTPDGNRSVLEKYGLKKKTVSEDEIDENEWEEPGEVNKKRPLSAPASGTKKASSLDDGFMDDDFDLDVEDSDEEEF